MSEWVSDNLIVFPPKADDNSCVFVYSVYTENYQTITSIRTQRKMLGFVLSPNDRGDSLSLYFSD